MGAKHTDPGAGKIGITLGDPSGIGPEIVACALAEAPEDLLHRVVVFCDRSIAERAFATLAREIPPAVSITDRGQLSPDQACPGQPTDAGARAQVAYLEAAATAARANDIAAVVTAPISKSQARRAGFPFAGQTEFFAHRLGATSHAMMFCGPRFRIVLATIHVPLASVSSLLTIDRIAEVTRLGVEALRRDFGIERPTVGVLGLNPHAGEDGAFGREEIDVIAPAVEHCRRHLECDIDGPLVPDAAYRHHRDLFVAMYHDQALIPAKLDDFDRTVNVTLGLPIVRTSPDHGVAYAIAGTGQARHESFAAALALAAELIERSHSQRFWRK